MGCGASTPPKSKTVECNAERVVDISISSSKTENALYVSEKSNGSCADKHISAAQKHKTEQSEDEMGDQMGAPYTRPAADPKVEASMNSSDYADLARRLSKASTAHRLYGRGRTFSDESDLSPMAMGKAFSLSSRHSNSGDMGRFMGKTASMASAATSSGRWRDEEETMILMDWDDTLFPTTWLREKQWFKTWLKTLEGADQLEQYDKLMLSKIDQAAYDFVVAASSQGKVCCVTLAVRPWQFWTMDKFLPRLAQAWQQNSVEVCYAREEVCVEIGSRSRRGRSDSEDGEEQKERLHVKQKKKAMQRLIKKFYKQGSWKNVVSIGDGPAEREALQDLGFNHRNPVSRKSGQQKKFRAKTVQMVQDPTCEQLVAQIEVLTAWLPSLVLLDDDFDVDFNQSEEKLFNLQEVLGDLIEDITTRSPISPHSP